MTRIQEAYYDIKHDIDDIVAEMLRICDKFLSSDAYDEKVIGSYNLRKDVYLAHVSEFDSPILKLVNEINPVKVSIGFLENSPKFDYINKKIVVGFPNFLCRFLVEA